MSGLLKERRHEFLLCLLRLLLPLLYALDYHLNTTVAAVVRGWNLLVQRVHAHGCVSTVAARCEHVQTQTDQQPSGMTL